MRQSRCRIRRGGLRRRTSRRGCRSLAASRRTNRRPRTRGVDPEDVEMAVVLLDVAGPELVAVAIEGDEVAGTVVEPGGLAVGDRGGGGQVVALVAHLAFADFLRPEDLAVGAVHGQGQ